MVLNAEKEGLIHVTSFFPSCLGNFCEFRKNTKKSGFGFRSPALSQYIKMRQQRVTPRFLRFRSLPVQLKTVLKKSFLEKKL